MSPLDSPPAPLEVVGLEVRLGDAPILLDLDLKLGAAERLALVGPSGAGKTTLLRTLAGSHPPAKGSVRVSGRDVTTLPPQERDTIYLSQRPLLFPHLSVFENVAFPLRVRSVERESIERRVHEALDAVRMGRFGARMPATLSGGQAHRIALARAVVARPRVLLLDEPLSSLDPTLREEVRQAVMDVHAGYGPAMILVTHDLSEAGRSADRVAVLLAGKLAQVAPPHALFADPATASVARFLGWGNELPGRLDEAGKLSVYGWKGGPGPMTVATTQRHSADVTVLFDIDAARIVPTGEGQLRGRVSEVLHEPRGARVRVAVESGAGGVSEIACRVHAGTATTPAVDSDVDVALDPKRLRAFSPDQASSTPRPPRA